jgi:hypothetical protein
MSSLSFVTKGREVEEVLKCTKSVIYFIWHYVKIIHPVYGKVPFKLYPFQVSVLRKWLNNKYSVMLKPRQMGMSTLVCAYVLWLALFFPHKKILIVSIKLSVAKAMLNKVKRMYEGLPNFLKMEVVNGGGSDTRIGTVTKIEFANGSEIEISSATEDAGRSEAVSLLVMDEVAFQRYASSIWGAAQPTLSTGGRAILLSTAFGVGNFFHRTWVDALQGLNGFEPILLNWQMHPERGIKWYLDQLKKLGAKRTAQEIDCDFLKSGYNVFNLDVIREIDDRLRERVPVEVHLNGDLKVYFRPEKGKKYVIGSDVSTGRSRDYSTFSVMDLAGKEYACYKGKASPRELAHLLMEWGARYNYATLAPEVNALGEGVTATIQEHHYPNIFHSIAKTLKLEQFEKDTTLIAGWFTTGKTRHEIITGLDDDLEEGLVELWNPFFTNESYTFIYNDNNKPIALGKELGRGRNLNAMMLEDAGESVAYTDDAIFSVCIANEVRKQVSRFSGNMPISGGK